MKTPQEALLAHVWRAATWAWGIDPDVVTAYFVAVGHWKRVTPPLLDTYLGNASSSVPAKARARELAENGLGWAAWQLNQAVASKSEDATRRHLEEWVKKPEFTTKQKLSGPILITGNAEV
ncbi:hypothetical protein HPP92_010819 [Vanilla planifolia]|uniref:Uncharacterized protein n=1 Tax=Vanilla planifolia TaxID=51239 RepID=A0A835QUL7_VANPL|nr:hypothetical protein HPP92_010819 [Vanilla planifolia]